MRDAEHVARLETIRARREPARRGLPMQPMFQTSADQLERRRSRLARVAAVWERQAPLELEGRVGIVSLERGVLTLWAENAGVKWRLDRALRAGLEAKLIRAAPTTVRRVRICDRPADSGAASEGRARRDG